MTHQMPSFSSLVLSSQYGGGGVYVAGEGATVTFNDCQIISNTASNVSKQARSGLLAVCFALLRFTRPWCCCLFVSLVVVDALTRVVDRRFFFFLSFFLLRLLLLLLGQIHKVSA